MDCHTDAIDSLKLGANSIFCRTGTDVEELYTACVYGQFKLEKSPDLSVLAPDQKQFIKAFSAPIPELANEPVTARVFYMLENVLQNILAQLPELNPERNVCLLILPSKSQDRSEIINRRFINNLLPIIDPQLRKFARYYVSEESKIMRTILKYVTKVVNGELDGVLLGAVDCLISANSFTELITQQNIMTNLNTDGRAPGEAACMVYLHNNTEIEPVQLSHLAQSKDISAALLKQKKSAQLSIEQIRKVILPSITSPSLAQQWHAIIQKCWCTPEQKGEFILPQTIAYDRVIGDVGAANLVISLLLAKVALEQSQDLQQTALVYQPEIGVGQYALLRRQ